MQCVFSGIGKAIALAALLVIAALLAWAFEERNTPALRVWHTALNDEFMAQDATGVGGTIVPSHYSSARRIRGLAWYANLE